MRNIILAILTVLSLMLFVGCGTYRPPERYQLKNDRIINKSFDQVWDRLVEWFALNVSPVKNMDRSSGFIASEYNLRVPLPLYMRYCDCGTTVKLTYDSKLITLATGNFNVLVRDIGSASTRVVVTATFQEAIWYARGSEVVCESTGVLEKEILDYVSK